jgi:hypothetical protein
MEAAPEIHYQRLTRSVGRSTNAWLLIMPILWLILRTRASLWLGPDHLLCVESNGYAETYKRFYFRDIQAIIVQETRRRAIYNAILAVPVLGCLIGLLACLTSFAQDEVGAIVWLIFLSIFLLLVLVNSLLGAGCASYLRTAVQIEQLPSLCRIPKTRRVLDKLRPYIVAAQGGELSAEQVSTRMRESVEYPVTTTPAQAVAENPNNPTTPNP